MKLLMGFGNQLAFARLRRRGHGSMQGFFAADQNDLLLCTRDCRVEKIAPEHLLTIRTDRYNHSMIGGGKYRNFYAQGHLNSELFARWAQMPV